MSNMEVFQDGIQRTDGDVRCRLLACVKHAPSQISLQLIRRIVQQNLSYLPALNILAANPRNNSKQLDVPVEPFHQVSWLAPELARMSALWMGGICPLPSSYSPRST